MFEITTLCFDKSITSFWEGELSGGGVNGGTLRNAIHKNWYSIFYQWHKQYLKVLFLILWCHKSSIWMLYEQIYLQSTSPSHDTLSALEVHSIYILIVNGKSCYSQVQSSSSSLHGIIKETEVHFKCSWNYTRVCTWTTLKPIRTQPN